MYFWLLLSLAIFTIYILFKLVFLYFDSKRSLKDAFNLPFYYTVIKHDLGKNPEKFYIQYKGVIGTPDAIFKHAFLPIIILGEAKSRFLNKEQKNKASVLKLREEYQLLLYIGIYKKNHPFSFVSGRFRFSNTTYPLYFNRSKFNYVFDLKNKAISALHNN